MSVRAEVLSDTVVPVPWVSGECSDERFPKLSGDWVVGCRGLGSITRAWNLRGGFGVQFESMGVHPALYDGLIVDFESGLVVDLNRAECLASDDLACGAVQIQPSHTEIIGPYFMNGDSVSVSAQEGIYIFTYGSNQRELLSANPSSWYPPAVGDGWVAWSEPSTETGVERGMFWSRETVTPVVIGDRGENVRHLTSSGDYLAWIEDSSVVIAHVVGGEVDSEARFPSDAHSSSSISLNGPVACWESWGEGVDIECSDGRRVDGSGHQRYPSHSDDWLVYRVDGVTMTTTFVVASGVDQQEANEPLD